MMEEVQLAARGAMLGLQPNTAKIGTSSGVELGGGQNRFQIFPAEDGCFLSQDWPLPPIQIGDEGMPNELQEVWLGSLSLP